MEGEVSVKTKSGLESPGWGDIELNNEARIVFSHQV